MVTILLQQILDLLKGFFGDFVEWCNTMGDHMAAIHTNTDSLPDIETNTDSIKNDTSTIKGYVHTITTNTSLMHSKITNIRDNTEVIKNNVGSIATSSGTAAAFAEDCATNTLNIDNRLVTIGSDTTQIRADSGNLAADVAEIKDTLGLYLYNTIVTEDAEGAIAFCDTDLKDYLTEAKVTIPADAGGITGITLTQQGNNMWDEVWENGFIDSSGVPTVSPTSIRSVNFCKCKPNTKYFLYVAANVPTAYILFYDSSNTFISRAIIENTVKTTPANAAYFKISCYNYGATYNDNISINSNINVNTYAAYESVSYPISFTSITDGAEIDLLTGLIKINTSPVTYDSITPIAIRTYKGVNNFYSDIGTTSVTYRETLKHYLKKQEA